MYTQTIIATAFGLILTILALLQQIALWQLKEYRWDRFKAELRTQYIQPSFRWGLVGLLIIAALLSAGWIGLAILSIWRAHHLILIGITKPRLTVKAIFIALLAVAIQVIFFSILTSVNFIAADLWLLMTMLAPLAAAAATVAGNLLGSIQKRRILEKARHHRQGLGHLKVIGITGSYGKTSTKYFLHHLLTGEASTAIMSASRRNELYVIAQDMLARLTPACNIYIVEMAAYRQGEIAQLANLTRPAIGVVTAIKNQHLSLFGSLADLAQAKWELIQSLPSNGVAVLNADDPTIQAQAKHLSGRCIWYSAQHQAEVFADNLDFQTTCFTATFHLGNIFKRLTLHLAGEGYLHNATAAAAAALAVGTPPSVIFDRLSSLQPVPQTMTIQTNSRGAFIIDDSYSANEDGVMMALRHLNRFSQSHKMVVLRPLIELGKDTTRVYSAISSAVATAKADLFLYNTANANVFERLARKAGVTAICRMSIPRHLARAVAHAASSQTVCLLENRLPAVVRRAALA